MQYRYYADAARVSACARAAHATCRAMYDACARAVQSIARIAASDAARPRARRMRHAVQHGIARVRARDARASLMRRRDISARPSGQLGRAAQCRAHVANKRAQRKLRAYTRPTHAGGGAGPVRGVRGRLIGSPPAATGAAGRGRPQAPLLRIP